MNSTTPGCLDCSLTLGVVRAAPNPRAGYGTQLWLVTTPVLGRLDGAWVMARAGTCHANSSNGAARSTFPSRPDSEVPR